MVLDKLNKNKFKLVLLYFITITILVFIFSKIDFYEVLRILKDISLAFFFIALFFNFINIIVHADKWRLILRYLGLNMRLKEAVFLELSSLPTRILLPFKSGELIQALYLKKKRNFPIKKGAFSLIITIVSDFCTLLFYTGIGILILKINFLEVRLWFFIILLFFIITFLFLSIFKIKYILKIHEILKAILNFIKSIQIHKIICLFFYSMFFYLITFITYFFVFKSLMIIVPFKQFIFFIPLILMITQIPVTISGFGTREATIIYFFSNYASQETLIAAGLLISLIIYIIPAFLGIFLQKKLFKLLLK